MARNKYPEQTVSRIVESATRLFLEKGYENTTIQDILNDLGDLSKGAIYHHFKSKEDILDKVSENFCYGIRAKLMLTKVQANTSGIEKLQQMMMLSLEDKEQEQLVQVLPNLMDNPKILAMQIKGSMEIADEVLFPILQEGIEDGSIQINYPKEMAEVLLLIANIWLNPMVLKTDHEELQRRLQFFGEITEKLGVPLMSEKLKEQMIYYNKIIREPKG